MPTFDGLAQVEVEGPELLRVAFRLPVNIPRACEESISSLTATMFGQLAAFAQEEDPSLVTSGVGIETELLDSVFVCHLTGSEVNYAWSVAAVLGAMRSAVVHELHALRPPNSLRLRIEVLGGLTISLSEIERWKKLLGERFNEWWQEQQGDE